MQREKKTEPVKSLGVNSECIRKVSHRRTNTYIIELSSYRMLFENVRIPLQTAISFAILHFIYVIHTNVPTTFYNFDTETDKVQFIMDFQFPFFCFITLHRQLYKSAWNTYSSYLYRMQSVVVFQV